MNVIYRRTHRLDSWRLNEEVLNTVFSPHCRNRMGWGVGLGGRPGLTGNEQTHTEMERETEKGVLCFHRAASAEIHLFIHTHTHTHNFPSQVNKRLSNAPQNSLSQKQQKSRDIRISLFFINEYKRVSECPSECVFAGVGGEGCQRLCYALFGSASVQLKKNI